MRGLRVLILVCATVSAMAAMWMMRSALQSQASLPPPTRQIAAAQPVEEPVVKAPTTSQVLVANRDIPTGRVLGPEDMRWQPWPADAVSENFYTEGEDVDAIETLTGSASRLVIVEGEPITTNKIVDLNGTGVLAALLRPGMRAVSIPISEITGAGGFILPGDFVDILLTRQIEIEEIDEDSGAVEFTTRLNQTDTVMKTVRVLAIDQQLNETQNAASVGTSATAALRKWSTNTAMTSTRSCRLPSSTFMPLPKSAWPMRSSRRKITFAMRAIRRTLPRLPQRRALPHPPSRCRRQKPPSP